jgi:NADP-dependent 3-hydroxy acid dehydrogenase YdfG
MSAGVIVGGSSGIGRATCMALAASHPRLLVVARHADTAAAVAREASDAGASAEAFACDIRNLEEVEALREHASKALGEVNFLIVSSGITQGGGIVEADSDRWRPLLETNVLGVAHCLRVFLPVLESSGPGQAVIVASLSGRDSYPGQPLYIASKWGELGLVHSVRKEAQSRGVRVTLIEPGLVDTPMSRGNPYAQRIFEQVKPLTPDDVARAILYVLEQPPNVLIVELSMQPIGQLVGGR